MKDFNTITGHNWGTGPIELKLGNFALEFKPVEIHLKEDGAIDAEGNDKPLMCIVMVRGDVQISEKLFIYGQLSLEMWNKALGEIGYEIRKK